MVSSTEALKATSNVTIVKRVLYSVTRERQKQEQYEHGKHQCDIYVIYIVLIENMN